MIVMMAGMALGVGYHSLCGVPLLFARVDLDCRTEGVASVVYIPSSTGVLKNTHRIY
jgi:hypothetical protein